MQDMQRTLINLSLDHMGFLEGQIAALDQEIAVHVQNSQLQAQYEILQTVPGVKEQAAASLLAEFGPDMKVFGTGAKCSAWAGVAPGNNESAGRKKRAPALRGNPWVRSTLVQCAWSASRKNGSEFQQQYERLKPRIGHKRAIVAVAHALTIVIFQVLSTNQPYTKPGANPMPQTQAARLIRHHTRRLKTLRCRLKTKAQA
jgi:transposase